MSPTVGHRFTCAASTASCSSSAANATWSTANSVSGNAEASSTSAEIVGQTHTLGRTRRSTHLATSARPTSPASQGRATGSRTAAARRSLHRQGCRGRRPGRDRTDRQHRRAPRRGAHSTRGRSSRSRGRQSPGRARLVRRRRVNPLERASAAGSTRSHQAPLGARWASTCTDATSTT